MKEFNPKYTKYIYNIGRGTLHYYNTQRCSSSKKFNPKDTNLKFYNTEDEVQIDIDKNISKENGRIPVTISKVYNVAEAC